MNPVERINRTKNGKLSYDCNVCAVTIAISHINSVGSKDNYTINYVSTVRARGDGLVSCGRGLLGCADCRSGDAYDVCSL